MKIAVTGYGGLLKGKLLEKGCISLSSDITKTAIKREIKKLSPDVIIHCAAKTNVDWCEQNKLEAFRVNCLGTSNIVDAFPKGLLVYISTSHVFDGYGWYPYSESHIPNPINVYGITKYAAETISRFRLGRTIVVRISKLFSKETILPDLQRLWNGEELEFSILIRRSYTYVDFFADALLNLIEISDKVKDDTLHLSSDGDYSEYQFWLSVAQVFGVEFHQIKQVRTERKELTPRPLRAAFHCAKAYSYGLKLGDVRSGLKEIKKAIE